LALGSELDGHISQVFEILLNIDNTLLQTQVDKSEEGTESDGQALQTLL
jgi:hypothetical protein